MNGIIAIIIAYLLGSISCSILWAKIQHKTDPREQGSGNAGATNVLRGSGKQDAAIVLVGDLVKALVAVIIARLIGVDGLWLGLVVVAAVAGHIFPLYFKFKGGKGVACFVGATLGISFFAGIIVIATWMIIAYLCKYASLASLISVVLGVLLIFVGFGAGLGFGMLIAAALIAWKHMDNIQRLRNGTESKLQF